MSTQGNEEKTDFKKNLEMMMRNKNNLQDPIASIIRMPDIQKKPIHIQTSIEIEQITNESDAHNLPFKADKLTDVLNVPIKITTCTRVPIIPQVPGFQIPSIPMPINKSTENVPHIKETRKEHIPMPIPITNNNNKIPQVPGIAMIPLIKTPVITSTIPHILGVPKPLIGNNIPQVPGVPKTPNIGVLPVAPVNNLNHIPGVPNIPGVPGINNALNTLNSQIPKIPIPGVKNLPPALHNNVPNIPALKIPFPSMINSPQKGPLLKSKPKVKSVMPMKALYWIVIDQKKLSDSIWLNLDDSQYSINASKFEEEFCQKKRDAIIELKDNNNRPVIIGKPSVLLPSRQQNINIVLFKLKLTPITIVEALIVYDEKVLTSQTCDLLLSILPTPAEINIVDSFDGDPMTLADADQFVLLMKTAPGYDLRLKSILFQKCYKHDKEELMKRIQCFFKAFEFISSNKKFHRWLEIVLAYGNYLNGATNRGGAFAYKLDILSKLAELKSNDNRKNLLFHIVEYIGDGLKEDELLNFSKDFEIFSSLLFSTINELYKEFNLKFKTLTNLLNILQSDNENLEEDDRSAEFISSFYSETENSLKLIEENIKRIEEEYSVIIKKFGDSPKDMPMETLFEILNKFGKDLTANVAIYMRSRELKQKMEKKKMVELRKK